MARSQHERQFIRINGMHLAIIDNDAYVTGITTRQGTMLHAIHDTFQDGRHETSINSPTDNGVDKDKLASPLQVDDFLVLNIHLELLTTELI